jgi:hypothetical protein
VRRKSDGDGIRTYFAFSHSFRKKENKEMMIF